MAKAYFQLSVATEGLSEEWITFPGLVERVHRSPMTPEQFAVLCRRINSENGMGATCRFILNGKTRQLQLDLVHGRYSACDPEDANYQNVGIGDQELETFLTDYFAGCNKSARQPNSPTPGTGQEVELEPELPVRTWRIMEGSIAVVVLLAFIATVVIIKKYPEKITGLMGVPNVVEIENDRDAREIVDRWAGVYATHVHDGGMVIELKNSGDWAYYEIWKYTSGNYVMDQLHAGQFRPVLEENRTAILTDSRFLFYPDDRQQLIFLDRPFKRIGDKLSELSYLIFPTNMETSLAGAP